MSDDQLTWLRDELVEMGKSTAKLESAQNNMQASLDKQERKIDAIQLCLSENNRLVSQLSGKVEEISAEKHETKVNNHLRVDHSKRSQNSLLVGVAIVAIVAVVFGSYLKYGRDGLEVAPQKPLPVVSE